MKKVTIVAQPGAADDQAMQKLIYLIRKLFGFIFRPIYRPIIALLSAIQLRIGGNSARRRRRAMRMAKTMLHEFSRLGFTRRMVTGGKKRGKVKRQRVRYEEPLLMTVDELWCPIDLGKLPTGVTTDMLRDESVLRSIQDRLDCNVRVDYLANGKLCFVIRYGGAQFPETFGINAVSWPEDAPALSIPLGVNADGEQQFADLADLVHLLIAGATSGGKTTLQHTIITSLINRNTVDDLELWLIDLKRTEFNLYRPLLGAKNKGGIVGALAVDSEEAIDVLDRALREINRRNQLMEQHNATGLADLAQLTGIRMKRIVLIIDEFAQLTLDTSKLGKQSIGKIAENLITRIAALGRSAGFTIIIATQMVQSAVVSGLIRANFENRIAFSTADWRQSQLIIESSEADGLPRGRAVARLKGATKMVQTALISARQVRIEVDRVAQFGPDGAWGEDVELQSFVRDAKLLIQAASDHFAGEMARAKILALDGIRGVITMHRFNEVVSRLERDGIIEPGGPRKPRKVSRGFHGRAGLIDSLYGLSGLDQEPTIGSTVKLENAYGSEGENTVQAHSDEINADPEVEQDTDYGLEESATHVSATDQTQTEDHDPEPPAWWNKIEPTPAKTVKRRILKQTKPKRR